MQPHSLTLIEQDRCSVFFPLLARVGTHQNVTGEARLSHSPLFLLIDGYSAVYLFFVMSGFVLAGSFLHSAHAFYWLALKRFVRLYLPVLAAFVCNFLLCHFPRRASRRSGHHPLRLAHQAGAERFAVDLLTARWSAQLNVDGLPRQLAV